MATFNYDDFEEREKKREERANRPKVGYFSSLKDDGDETIVRFAYNTSKEFDVTTVHKIQIDGRWKNISCLRGAYDSEDKCPLCGNGEKVFTRIFVKLVEYVKDENGKIVPQAKVFDRPVFFAKELKNALEEYGYDSVFKIKRFGVKGSMQTTYKIMFANPAVYKEELYPKDFSAFTDFDLSKHSYFVKTKEEMEEFIETGKFPEKVEEDNKESQFAEKEQKTQEETRKEVTEERHTVIGGERPKRTYTY